jgi:hypothetical protein
MRVILREFDIFEENTSPSLASKNKPRKKAEAASGNINLSLPQTGHDRFFPDPAQIIIH